MALSETLTADLVDRTILQYSDLQQLNVPLELVRPPSYFSSVSSFCELTLNASMEMFREEIEQQVRLCGSKKPPHEKQPHAQIINPFVHGEVDLLGGGLCSIAIGPYSGLTKYPIDNPKASYNKFAVLVQVVRGGRELENVCVALCESMSKKKDGVALQLTSSMANALFLKVDGAHALYLRKLKNFGFMTLQPLIALQRIATETPDLPADSIAYRAFLKEGGIDDTSTKLAMFPQETQLDAWIDERKVPSAFLNLEKFNKIQQRALALAGSTDGGIVLIQGPPGTGKSHLIANGLLPSLVESGRKGVLVVCQSNCAVDSIAEKAVSSDSAIRNYFVRVGYRNKVAPAVLAAGVYRESAEEVLKDNFGSRGKPSIMFTTLYNACTDKFTDVAADKFDTIIFDEAAQIEDMKVFSLLVKFHKTLRKMVLVGDHQQLQPYVSDSARSKGYGVSTMERLIKHFEGLPLGERDEGIDGVVNGNVVHVMLEAQHRMPTAVRSIVSELYYNGRLIDGPNINSGRALQTIGCGVQIPSIIAFDLSFGSAEFDVWQRSSENFEEAEASALIYEFIEKELQQSDGSTLGSQDICILSPFNRHKNRLRTVVAGLPEDQWQKFEYTMDGAGPTDPFEIKIRNIDTVDKFQGSERAVVMINTVVETGGREGCRSRDPHFINVAMSRSKSLLVLVGHLSAIGQRDNYWKKIVEHTEANDDCCLFQCSSMQDVKSSLRGLLSKRRRIR